MSYISSFKGRIIAVVIVMLIASLAIANFLSYRQLSTAISGNISTYSKTKIDSTTEKVDTWFQTIKQGLVGSASAFAEPMSIEEKLRLVKQVNAVLRVSEVLVGYEDGSSFAAELGQLDVSDYDPRSRGWYKEAKAAGKTVITDMYKDAFTNNLLVSIAEPFYKNGQLKGVMIADIELTVLAKIINQSSFDNASVSLLDPSAVFIASTNNIRELGKTKLSDQSGYAELESKILNNNNGTLETNANGDAKISYYQAIALDAKTNWYLLISLDKAATYQQIDDNLIDAITTSLILVLCLIVIISVILNQLYRPILALKATVMDLADGDADLTQRLAVNGNDDLAQIANAVNKFVANLQTMMQEVSQSTRLISDGIEQLQQQADVNNNVLVEHADETQQVVVAITEMSSTADSVAKSAALAATYTQDSTEEANQSKAVVKNAVANVADLTHEVDAMALHISTMSEDTHKISSVLSVIGEIADQTNLLALNAAIEAARAGEQGRGFAVVADEVRTLAARTQQSTSEINDMLARLRTGSDTVVTAMENTKESCQQTAETTASVNVNLDSMTDSVMQINDLGIQIATAAEQQSSVSEEINRNMFAIQTMVDQLSENSSKTMANSHSLADSNSQLMAVVSRFKLN